MATAQLLSDVDVDATSWYELESQVETRAHMRSLVAVAAVNWYDVELQVETT